MNNDNNRLRALPKVDLHVHLDGSIRPSFIIDMAREEGRTLPTVDPNALFAYMQAELNCESLVEYLSTFDFVLPFLQSYYALERASYELLEQAAQENCRYVEVRFAPQLHLHKGLTVDDAIQAVCDGLARGSRQFDLTARCIVICLRGHSESVNMAVVEAAGRFIRLGVVAVDLAGAEAQYPPELYEAVFARAKQLQLPITIHAGEAGGADNVRTAVDQLGATRIGHGVRLHERRDVMEMIRERGIPLEMCPTSNIQTKAVNSWEQYPLRTYYDAGIKVTVNTDNLTVSGTTITNEYKKLHDIYAFSDEDWRYLVRNGVDAAFLEGQEKVLFVDRMEKELAAWISAGRNGNEEGDTL